MELLVYARNYRPYGSAEQAGRRELGASVGERVPAFGLGERLCSFVEARLPVDVLDLGTEIELLVAKAFAVWGHPGSGRVLRFANARGSVAMLLEPGFERTRDLCRALYPVLPQARAMLERAVERPAPKVWKQRATSRPVPRASAAPTRMVDPDDERVAPLWVPSDFEYRFVPPPLPFDA
jgi:hypothetical protein